MGLRVQSVSKWFGTKKVVDNLSFSMEEPGVFGLIGTNGAGKTTTIRMILGIADIDEGTVTWNDGPLNRQRVRYGYMPEERGLYPKVKVLEQLVYFGELRGMKKRNALTAAEYWMERLGVTEYKQVPAEKLSKGNQQKIQLIATILHDPELIILDEPFSGLDPINTDIFKSVFMDLIQAKKYIVMSSHQMSTVEEYCKDILMLDKGKTLLSGNLRQIKAGYGHTHLSVYCSADILPYAEKHGLQLLSHTADNYEFKISGDEAVQAMLKELIANDIFPEKFEIREPSLHEIFVEKAGAAS